MDGWQVLILVGLGVAVGLMLSSLLRTANPTRDTFVDPWVDAGIAFQAVMLLLAVFLFRGWPTNGRRQAAVLAVSIACFVGVCAIGWGVFATFEEEFPQNAPRLILGGLLVLSAITVGAINLTYHLHPRHLVATTITVITYLAALTQLDYILRTL